MTEERERDGDQDPAPTKHSDAKRVSEAEAHQVPTGKDAQPEELPEDAA